MIQIDKIIQRVDEFPTLPTIYMALSDVMANPRSTVNDAARIITRDQSSASKVLKAANSSIYGIKGRITTISQAIFFIGFDEVKNLIVALSVMKLFQNTKATQNLNPIDLWKHSIATGVITRNLGKAIGIKHLENYFIAGILHDIGKLFFLKYMPEDYAKALMYAYNNKISAREAENKLFGISHTSVGDMLAEKWKLPRILRNVISNHYSGISSEKEDVLVACVHAANVTAHILELGNLGDEYVPEPNLKVWEELHLPDNAFTKCLPQIMLDYEESMNLLMAN